MLPLAIAVFFDGCSMRTKICTKFSAFSQVDIIARSSPIYHDHQWILIILTFIIKSQSMGILWLLRL